MIKKLLSIKRIFAAVALGAALLMSVGVASAQTFRRGRVIIVQHHNRNWERQRRREFRRWERQRRRHTHYRRWRDRWGVWHWSR